MKIKGRLVSGWVKVDKQQGNTGNGCIELTPQELVSQITLEDLRELAKVKGLLNWWWVNHPEKCGSTCTCKEPKERACPWVGYCWHCKKPLPHKPEPIKNSLCDTCKEGCKATHLHRIYHNRYGLPAESE